MSYQLCPLGKDSKNISKEKRMCQPCLDRVHFYFPVRKEVMGMIHPHMQDYSFNRWHSMV